tara:strand:+ start:964 stop:1317 length:354 start_codon:yes stop_codon:yes gene_type:complete
MLLVFGIKKCETINNIMVTISAKKIIALDSLNGLKPVACIIVNSLSFFSLLVTIVAAAKAASGAIIGIIGGIVKIENSKNTRKVWPSLIKLSKSAMALLIQYINSKMTEKKPNINKY